MLISRKFTKDKSCVCDFRHINTRKTETSLAFPLLRDTFSLLGSSKCEVLSVINLKDAFHSLRLADESKKYLGYCHTFAVLMHQRMPVGLNTSPAILQSCINTFLDCLQSRR